jgi:CysZ protein
MIADARDALIEIFSPPFRRLMGKSLALTAAVLVVVGVALDRLAVSFLHVGPAWLGVILSVVVALGLVVGLIFLVPPTASLVAGFFLDEAAEIVERSIEPYAPPGRPIPLGPSIAMGVRFAILSVLVNIVVLALTIFAGVGLIAFFILNGYLLGREYFELAAMRRVSAAEARLLFQRNLPMVFLAGLVVAGFVVVPILNLLTPLFATAFMIRICSRIRSLESRTPR